MTDPTPTPLLDRILAVVTRHPDGVGAQEIATQLGLRESRRTLNRHLLQLGLASMKSVDR